ncbi:MAG: hypothetical protein M3388_00220 [Acidobacteriota bacterium]|nr:hypothetical protein [Acidobacteriota bacterium]
MARSLKRDSCQTSNPSIPSNIKNINAIKKTTASRLNPNPFIKANTAIIIPNIERVIPTIDQMVDSTLVNVFQRLKHWILQ